MPYNPTLEKLELLSPFTKEIMALEPGQSVSFKSPSRESMNTLRYSLYEWMHGMGVKSLFRLKTLSTTELWVIRLGHDLSKIEIKSSRLSTDERSILDSLVTMDQLLAFERLEELLREGDISEKNYENLSRELTRFFS